MMRTLLGAELPYRHVTTVLPGCVVTDATTVFRQPFIKLTFPAVPCAGTAGSGMKNPREPTNGRSEQRTYYPVGAEPSSGQSPLSGVWGGWTRGQAVPVAESMAVAELAGP